MSQTPPDLFQVVTGQFQFSNHLFSGDLTGAMLIAVERRGWWALAYQHPGSGLSPYGREEAAKRLLEEAEKAWDSRKKRNALTFVRECSADLLGGEGRILYAEVRTPTCGYVLYSPRSRWAWLQF
jgi:hypothetical protein